jgi:hypothetical protein
MTSKGFVPWKIGERAMLIRPLGYCRRAVHSAVIHREQLSAVVLAEGYGTPGISVASFDRSDEEDLSQTYGLVRFLSLLIR